jgi:hypothetical protein
MLKAFFDDSGSGGDSTWYVLAGYLGRIEGWDSFDSQWREVLRTHPRIEYFKASEAESLRLDGQWAGVSKVQRDLKIEALIGVIGRCARRSICVRMRQRDYDQVVKGNVPTMWDSPYYLLFTIAVAAAINIERLDGESDHVDFVFDSDQKHQRQFKLMLPPLRKMTSLDGKFVNAVRCDEKKVLPLQAADLFAWQIRRFLEPINEPRRKHFPLARDCPPKEAHSFILDRGKLVEMVRDVHETAARTAVSLGRSPDVRTWR